MAVTILLEQVSKRYRNHWIFKGISYTFDAGKTYAILGANGSGKSTLLRIIAGMQHANKGKITYISGEKEITAEQIFSSVSFAAPGMDLIEEMTLAEFLNFHFTFKNLLKGHSISSIVDSLGMQSVKHKFLHEFSSGMKQRVKLAQAFFSDTPLLLLDEPCSNLDSQGVTLYQDWLDQYGTGRTTIIASNDEREYVSATHTLSVEDFK